VTPSQTDILPPHSSGCNNVSNSTTMMMRTELGGLLRGSNVEKKNFFLAFVEQETSQGRGGLPEFRVVLGISA